MMRRDDAAVDPARGGCADGLRARRAALDGNARLLAT